MYGSLCLCVSDAYFKQTAGYLLHICFQAIMFLLYSQMLKLLERKHPVGSIESQRDWQVLWCTADCILDGDLRISHPTEHAWICFLTSCHRAMPPTQRARIRLLQSSHTNNYWASLVEFNKLFTNHLFLKNAFI